jgi:hypothetical protein
MWIIVIGILLLASLENKRTPAPMSAADKAKVWAGIKLLFGWIMGIFGAFIVLLFCMAPPTDMLPGCWWALHNCLWLVVLTTIAGKLLTTFIRRLNRPRKDEYIIFNDRY